VSGQSVALSLRMQDIAQALDDILKDIAGERLSFVFVVQADGVAQYISNTDRKDGAELVRSLLARRDANRADIPAHFNPDLRA
jgi:hypothetical protein